MSGRLFDWKIYSLKSGLTSGYQNHECTQKPLLHVLQEAVHDYDSDSNAVCAAHEKCRLSNSAELCTSREAVISYNMKWK